MDEDDQLRENASLEQVLAWPGQRPSEHADRELHARCVQALRDAIEGGSASARGDATPPPARRYWFKLELPDGRWSVAEQALAVEPQIGDVVRFDDGGHWLVHTSQLVWPRPVRKPRREFFVCAPAP